MYKNVLQHIDQIEIWPVVSFVIFFLFFLMLIWHVATTDRDKITYLKNIPDNDGTGEPSHENRGLRKDRD